MLADYSGQPKLWMSYGHSLKTAGRQPDCIAAYRRSIELAPNLGEAYWSLANLKTFRFTDDDVAAMRAQLQREDLPLEDRWHLTHMSQHKPSRLRGGRHARPQSQTRRGGTAPAQNRTRAIA